MIALLALALAGLPPSVHPWPIGTGARYHPAAAPAWVRGARPVGAFRCRRDATRFSVHVELFANRRVIPIPSGIGVAAPFRRAGADVRPGGCVYRLHTTAPTGVVRVGAQAATVGDLFRVWGQRLGPRRLLSFGHARVRTFVGGRERHVDPRSVRLTPHAQIVLEIGGYVPPHPSYLFPKGAP
ncbi:MAG: hypothetical protein ACRDM1_07400 [Gaiellaceae bacterium]